MGGSFSDVQVVNSPGRAVAIGGSSLTVSSVTVNNGKILYTLLLKTLMCSSAAGTAANSASGGKPAGANTDGFDVSANDVTSCVLYIPLDMFANDLIVTGCTVNNQDDCLAINKGTTIVFENNVCEGIGHGISIVG